MGAVAKEGETVHQLNLLQSLDYDTVQGYYFSRPVEVAFATGMIETLLD